MSSPRPTKSQGQWALGEREPLNPNEQFKQDDDALNVRDRIINEYSRTGFDSIEKNDLRGRIGGPGSTRSASRVTTAASPATRTSTCSRPSTS